MTLYIVFDGEVCRQHYSLKKEHQSNSSDCIYNPEKHTRLSDIVNPVIIKLTKEDDGVGFGKLGPIYSPQHD